MVMSVSMMVKWVNMRVMLVSSWGWLVSMMGRWGNSWERLVRGTYLLERREFYLESYRERRWHHQ